MGKRQHYIPQSYLKHFTDPRTQERQDPYLWVFDRKKNEIKRRAPKNAAWSPHRYTFQDRDGTRNESLETGLSRVESLVATVKNIASNGTIKEAEKIDVAGYMGMLSARSPGNEEQVLDLLEWIHRTQAALMAAKDPKMREMIQESGLDKTPDEVARKISQGELFDFDIPRAMALEPTIQANVEVYTKTLPQMNWRVLRPAFHSGVLTSDHPVCMYSRIAAEANMPPGFMYPDIEITFPISRDMILLTSREDVEPDDQLTLEKTLLYNRRSFFHAEEFYAANVEIIAVSYNLLVDEVQRDNPEVVDKKYLKIER